MAGKKSKAPAPYREPWVKGQNTPTEEEVKERRMVRLACGSCYRTDVRTQAELEQGVPVKTEGPCPGYIYGRAGTLDYACDSIGCQFHDAVKLVRLEAAYELQDYRADHIKSLEDIERAIWGACEELSKRS